MHSQYCFGCSQENEKGLHLKCCFKKRKIEVKWEGEKFHEGMRGVIHGGVIATILDEAMSKLIEQVDSEREYFTGKLIVEFKKPLKIREKVKVIAELERKIRGGYIVKAVVKEKKGSVIFAFAKGIFLPG